VNVESSDFIPLRDLYSDPELVFSRAEKIDLATAAGALTEESVEGGKCLRGIFVGIAIEAAAAFSLYGAWRLWHLLR
jgi:hypothetical protein